MRTEAAMNDPAERVRQGLREALSQTVSAQLKPATFWDAVTIRIPQTWKCIREPDGMWECYESDDTEMETIWVDHDVFLLPDIISKSDEAFLAEVASVADTIGQSGDPGASRKIISAFTAHTIVNVTGTTMGHDGDGAELYSSMWHHIGAHRPYCIVVHLKLIAHPGVSVTKAMRLWSVPLTTA
jgi:hypothetical protein